MNRRIGSFILALIAVTLLHAQPYAELVGTITDPRGFLIPGATVIVTDSTTGQRWTVSSSGVGYYRVSFLPPGTYHVRVEHRNFRPAERHNVTLHLGQVLRVDFSLDLGAPTERAKQVSGAFLIQTHELVSSALQEWDQLLAIPSPRRDLVDFIKLTPYVAILHQPASAATLFEGPSPRAVDIAVGGLRPEFQGFILEGARNSGSRLNSPVAESPLGTVGELRVENGLLGAESSQWPSRVSIFTGKPRPAINGELFAFWTDDFLNARPWKEDGDKPPFSRRLFGATIGGPLGTGKTTPRAFFTVGGDSLTERRIQRMKATVAPLTYRYGDFSSLKIDIYDPLSRTFTTDRYGNLKADQAVPFPGRRVPESRIDPVALALLRLYPEPNRTTDIVFQNYWRTSERPLKRNRFTGGMEVREREASRWFLRASWSKWDDVVLANFSDQERTSEVRGSQAAVSNVRSLGRRWTGTFSLTIHQLTTGTRLRNPAAYGTSAALGIRGLGQATRSTEGLPYLVFDGIGLDSFGTLPYGNFRGSERLAQLAGAISTTRGDHAWKAGGEIWYERAEHNGDSYLTGVLVFERRASTRPQDPLTTGHTWADFLLGEVRRAQRALAPYGSTLKRTSGAVFFEDTWRVTRRLTVIAGVNYQYRPAFTDTSHRSANFQIFDVGAEEKGLLTKTQAPVLIRPGVNDFYDGLSFRLPSVVRLAVDDRLWGARLMRSDRNDVAPRIGLAYAATRTTSLRLGAGLFYVPEPAFWRFRLAQNLAGFDRTSASPETLDLSLQDPWRLAHGTSCVGWSGPCVQSPYLFAIAPWARSPYVWRWMAQLQQEVFRNTVLELGYQANAGHKLSSLRVLNQPVFRTGSDDARPLTQRQPWPGYGFIETVDPSANSNYHAMNFSIRRRFARTLTYVFSVTWSKAIDNASGLSDGLGDGALPASSYNLRHERALSSFHQGRTFVTAFFWQWPFGKRRLIKPTGWKDVVFGGWELGSIITLADGNPVNVHPIGDFQDLGLAVARPDATGISPFRGPRRAYRLWDADAFTLQESTTLPYRLGEIGRNALLTPGLSNWDFLASRYVHLNERHRFQFRIEIYNLFNRPNWLLPNTDFRPREQFGVVPYARPMREIQLSVRYLF